MSIYFERLGMERAERQIESVSTLKISELIQWREERLADARVYHGNPFFSDLVERYGAATRDQDAGDQVVVWLRQIRESYSYDRVFLFDSSGSVLSAWPPEGAGDPVIAAAVRQESRPGHVHFLDFYINPLDDRVYLSVLAPMAGDTNTWTLALRVDPDRFLYPFLDRWPFASRTAETLLVRRDEDSVQVLNRSRFHPYGPLELNVPLDPETDLPIGRAALGKTGIVRGGTLRSIPVLAFLAGVGDSPWFLVSKIDLEEVAGTTRASRLFLAGFVLALLGSEFTGVLATTRRWRLRTLELEARSARAVRENEERLRLALSAANQGLYDLNVGTGEAVVNDEYALMLGFDPEDFHETNAAWIDRLHPDDRESVSEQYRRYVSGETEEYRVEFRQRAKDGSWKWILSLGKIVERDAEGAPLRMLGTHTDITARKTAEEALRTSEERLRRILDEMMEGCQILACDWRFQYLNDTAVRYSRSHREDLLGKTLFECYPGVQDTELFAVLDACMKARKAATIENEFQFPDGTREWFQFNIQPIWEGLFILTLNISDRKRHEQDLLEMNRSLETKVEERTSQLQAKNRELEAFTYSVAHDLRAPLRGIDGFSRILQEEFSDPLGTEGKRLLDIVRSGAVKLDRLISSLLEYARSGRAMPSTEDVDMGTLARNAYRNCADPSVLDSFHTTFGEMPDTLADPGMMERVWTNLLSNAVKYSLPAKVHSIEVEGREVDDGLEYSVRDRGVGFDPKYADKLFGMFQRLHTEDAFPGSGIGLAIVRKLVELHGGRIWAEGRKGEGAVFRFVLPDRRHT